MAREYAISFYLFIVRILFTFCKMFPLKSKSTLVASFGHNIFYTARAVKRLKPDERIVILKTPTCNVVFEASPRVHIITFGTVNFVSWLRAIYHLATSRTVFVDNYYAFLAETRFKPDVRCIQLWHAAGAIKQFGLRDLSINQRSPKAYRRFKQVYHRFHYLVVGNEKMGIIFREGFGIKKHQLLKTGVPRTDFFYQTDEVAAAKNQFLKKYPAVREKKAILYAPTYRDGMFHLSEYPLDLAKIYTALKDEYILFIRVHPSVQTGGMSRYPDFIYDVSSDESINPLLVGADILVTDYSSVPFEFSLLAKPMIFFAYDLDEYAHARGFWEWYEDVVPGPIVDTTDALINVVKTGQYDMKTLNAFAWIWNQYSDGHSSERLVKTLYSQNQ